MVPLTEINNRVESELDEYIEPYLEMKDFSGARAYTHIRIRTRSIQYTRWRSSPDLLNQCVHELPGVLEVQGHEVDESLLVRLRVPLPVEVLLRLVHSLDLVDDEVKESVRALCKSVILASKWLAH